MRPADVAPFHWTRLERVTTRGAEVAANGLKEVDRQLIKK